MNLSEMRSRLRIDLHDEDSANYRWTDNQLDRHMGRAVRELSAAQPRPDVATIRTGSDGRMVSLASLPDLVRVEAVEYPVDESPPSYVDFGLRGPDLTLLVEEGPRGRGIGEGVLRTPSYPGCHRLHHSGPPGRAGSRRRRRLRRHGLVRPRHQQHQPGRPADVAALPGVGAGEAGLLPTGAGEPEPPDVPAGAAAVSPPLSAHRRGGY